MRRLVGLSLLIAAAAAASLLVLRSGSRSPAPSVGAVAATAPPATSVLPVPTAAPSLPPTVTAGRPPRPGATPPPHPSGAPRGLDLEQIEAARREAERARAEAASATAPAPRFPWPPPAASALMVLPDELLPHGTGVRFGDLESALRRALLAGGYSELSLFTVPGGFALATRVERVAVDGSPGESSVRWVVQSSAQRTLSLLDRLSEFFFVQPGYFRMLLFVASSESFTQGAHPVQREEAVSWLYRGANSLPAAIADQPLAAGVKTSVLVYEFVQPDGDRPAELQRPGHHSARQHLDRAGVWAALKR